MDPERPPDLDAEYRLIHGPWPRWVLQLSLLKLALRTAGIVVAFCLLGLLIALAVVKFGR
jgi:hypothetical protein